jgi:hypothetical protein
MGSEIIPFLHGMLQPWFEAIENPSNAQDKVLKQILPDYAKTQYGKHHHAEDVSNIDDYQKAFPVTNYELLKPLIDNVMGGEIDILLCEAPLGWAITRGTTTSESKYIPITPTDMRSRVSAGRAMMNFVVDSGRLDLFDRVNLNLNFPSIVGTLSLSDREIEYGYSSGIYTRFVSQMTPIRSVPSQEEIDALGGGKTEADWVRRFELAYQCCRGQNVTLVGGVCPTAIKFAQYLFKKYHMYPKQLWKTQIMTLGSVPGINTRFYSALNALYGPVIIREIYGTTEGIFGQQRNEKRAWVPNYDLFFFEILCRGKIKMLHDLKPGEIGSLIVSTPVLPRYRIGDLILASDPPYFRCIGREKWWTPLSYYWNEMSSLNFGQL